MIARDQCLAAGPGSMADPLVHAFRHDDILRFTTDLRIPPTSNQGRPSAKAAPDQPRRMLAD